MAHKVDDEFGGEYASSYPPGSFSRTFFDVANANESEDEQNTITDQIPKILLMGMRRSGKSSIQSVVFCKMSPNETVFLESTNKTSTKEISNSFFVQFKILDFPGQIDFFEPSFDCEKIFGGEGALVFVIDAQDEYVDALNRLHMTVLKAYKVNPKLKFEVFIHKVDLLSDDAKIETQRDIRQRTMDFLSDEGSDQINLTFHLTSIYDHSIFEAVSKVIQKLIPYLSNLEYLLNTFIANCAIEKAFLFDVSTKVYIATDSSPVDMQGYELCCDMIDVALDISSLYGIKDEQLKDDQVDQMSSVLDEESLSIIKLKGGNILYMREVSRFLALVCIIRGQNFQKPGLVHYNFLCFKKAIQDVCELHRKQTNSAHKTALTNGAGAKQDGQTNDFKDKENLINHSPGSEVDRQELEN